MTPLRPLYLPLEVKVRELKPKVLIAVLACARGLEVCVAQKDAFNAFAGRLAPGIVLGKSLNEVDARHFARCRGHGHRIATMDEEILVYFNRADIVRYLSPEAVALSDLILVPGRDGAEVVCAVSPDAAGRIRMVGLPRLDFLRPEFTAGSRARVEELRARHGTFVLVNGNFAIANSHLPPDHLIGVMRATGYVRTDADMAFYDSWVGHDGRALEAMIAMTAGLVERFPGTRFVVRPHPQERVEPYVDRLGRFANVVVSPPAEAVDVWLRAAAGLIQNGCTTAIEAYELGTPVLANLMVQDPRFNLFLPNALAESAATVDEAAAWLTRVLKGLPDHRPRERMANGRPYGFYIDRDTPGLSAARIVEALADWPGARDDAAGDPGSRLTPEAFAQQPYTPRPFDKSDYIAAKFPDTGIEEVAALVDSIRAVLPGIPPVLVRSPARDMFVLTPA